MRSAQGEDPAQGSLALRKAVLRWLPAVYLALESAGRLDFADTWQAPVVQGHGARHDGWALAGRDPKDCYTSEEECAEAMVPDSGSSCSGQGSDSEDGKWAPCLGSAAERVARMSAARDGTAHAAGSARGAAPRLVYEFFETASPHERAPLTERIAQLAEKFPGLHALRSSDLHPSSFIAIAWCAFERPRWLVAHSQNSCAGQCSLVY